MLYRIEIQQAEVSNMTIVEDETGCSKISYSFQRVIPGSTKVGRKEHAHG